MVNFWYSFNQKIVVSCHALPPLVLCTLLLLLLFVQILESFIEKLIFGEYFPHFLDVFISVFFLFWAVCLVYSCGLVAGARDD